jgi:hypothetical protein
MACACSGSSGPKIALSDVVSAIPWPDTESLRYLLIDKSGKQAGSGTLTVSREGANTRLGQSFTNGQNNDETSVIVDSRSLKPVSSTRTITGPSSKEELSVSYTSDGALIKQGDKQSGLSVPEHAYDNDTSLFLWRTLRFEPGNDLSYVAIITNRRSRQTVELKVIGREPVTVPAGDFQAWRVEVHGQGSTQTAWYGDVPSRPLVKYDNSAGTIFQLQSKP